MNYLSHIKNLVSSIKNNARYNAIPAPFKALAIIAMIPLIISFVISKFFYMVTVFFYKMISSPADHLHQWLKSQKNEVQHATQAVMYFICLPTIFFFQVLLSFSSFIFYIQWFFLMIQGYLLSLCGIDWQPFMFDAKFDAPEANDAAALETKTVPGTSTYIGFSCALFASFALSVVLSIVATVAQLNIYVPILIIGAIYDILLCIVNPILFRKRSK